MSHEYYHTGFVRDKKDKSVFRKVTDNTQVQLEGWDWGKPYEDDDRNIVLWYFLNNEKKNFVFNWNDHPHHFVCEYLV